jgi:uncharacterized cupin superfamily protein
MTRVITAPANSELNLDPLPEREVVEGSGNAETFIVAEADDETCRSGLWTCPVGTYRFFFPYEEHTYIIEGKVEVIDDLHGRVTHVLGPGDMAYFPVGSKTVWKVVEPLKKYFVMRD